jgi:hypothetical protein
MPRREARSIRRHWPHSRRCRVPGISSASAARGYGVLYRAVRLRPLRHARTAWRRSRR